MSKISNGAVRKEVQGRRKFRASNIFAVTNYPTTDTSRPCYTTRYVVYSYGEHFPLFICEEFDGVEVWYENVDKYSRTTSKHHSQAHPHFPTVPMNTNAMRTIARTGIAGLAAIGELQ